MPYKRMKLREAEVYARVDEAGAVKLVRGLVEIRYSRSSTKVYRAGAKNLAPLDDEILPDDYMAPVPSKNRKKASKKKSAPSGEAPPTAAVEGEILFYVDGACTGNPGPAGLGVVRLEGDSRRELSEFIGHGTNNIAELMAIQRAAESVENPVLPLRVYTDSKYSIGVLSLGWKAKANKELIGEVKNALARLTQFELIHVKGHAGFELNERADELAVQAVKSRATTDWAEIPASE